MTQPKRIRSWTGSKRLPWAQGVASRNVAHMGYVFPQPDSRAYGHHQLTGTHRRKPGAWTCGICGRWVVRGMGRWWEQEWRRTA